MLPAITINEFELVKDKFKFFRQYHSPYLNSIAHNIGVLTLNWSKNREIKIKAEATKYSFNWKLLNKVRIKADWCVEIDNHEYIKGIESKNNIMKFYGGDSKD